MLSSLFRNWARLCLIMLYIAGHYQKNQWMKYLQMSWLWLPRCLIRRPLSQDDLVLSSEQGSLMDPRHLCRPYRLGELPLVPLTSMEICSFTCLLRYQLHTEASRDCALADGWKTSCQMWAKGLLYHVTSFSVANGQQNHEGCFSLVWARDCYCPGVHCIH